LEDLEWLVYLRRFVLALQEIASDATNDIGNSLNNTITDNSK
jgi:hypothetical protein